jgi:hypothetical protein
MTQFQSKYPLLAYDRSNDYEQDYAFEIWGKYRNDLAAKVDTLPHGAKYLGCILHDSEVLSLSYENQEVIICLNDFSTHCFVDALSDMLNLGIPYSKTIFPLGLRFTGVSQCSMARVNLKEQIVYLSFERYFPRLKEFLYEEVIRLDEQCIEIGMIFTLSGRVQSKNQSLLQLRGSQLIFEEGQREAFINLVGKKYITIFDEYWNEREHGFAPDYSGAIKWLCEKNIAKAKCKDRLPVPKKTKMQILAITRPGIIVEKEIFSTIHQLKAMITLRTDGLYFVKYYKWTEDGWGECSTPIITDSKSAAERAVVTLRDLCAMNKVARKR